MNIQKKLKNRFYLYDLNNTAFESNAVDMSQNARITWYLVIVNGMIPVHFSCILGMLLSGPALNSYKT